PKAAAALKTGGVTSVAQIAAWTDADIERWDAAINGRGRIVRDDWVGQAKKLTG
ncbi:MAG: putative flap endonuclease-1-like 5' DNA nuclease, partial [Maricaulis maris]